MQSSYRFPWYTAAIIRGSAADLAAFKERACDTSDGVAHLDPHRFDPAPPRCLLDGPADMADGVEAMVLIGIADGIRLPMDCPNDGRAAKMQTWLSGPGRSLRHISADRWLTLRDAAGLSADAAEEAIAKAWLDQNPRERVDGRARLQRILETGYASIDLWAADHWGCLHLSVEPLEDPSWDSGDDEPSLELHLVGAAGAPDLLLKRIARANPGLVFEVTVAFDPDNVFVLELRGDKEEKREVDTQEEYTKAMKILGFETSTSLVEVAPGHIIAVVDAPA